MEKCFWETKQRRIKTLNKQRHKKQSSFQSLPSTRAPVHCEWLSSAAPQVHQTSYTWEAPGSCLQPSASAAARDQDQPLLLSQLPRSPRHTLPEEALCWAVKQASKIWWFLFQLCVLWLLGCNGEEKEIYFSCLVCDFQTLVSFSATSDFL